MMKIYLLFVPLFLSFFNNSSDNNILCSNNKSVEFGQKPCGENQIYDLGYGLKKIENNIYRNGKIVDGVDADSFEIIDEYYSKDKDNYFFEGENLSGYEYITGLDYSSFQVIGSGFSRDNNSVYGICKVGLRRLEGADVRTFEIINESYAKDSDKVFCKGFEIEGADPKSFKNLRTDGRMGYSKDKKHVYLQRDTICMVSDDADVDTFEYLTGGYARDKNYVWGGDASCLSGADPSTFEVINMDYTRDKNHVYYVGYSIDGADSKTFKVIGDNYSKDKNHVYCNSSIITGADSVTFEKTELGIYRDKNHIYGGGVVEK